MDQISVVTKFSFVEDKPKGKFVRSQMLVIRDNVEVSEIRDRSLRAIFKTWTYLRWPGDDGKPEEKQVFWKRLRIGFQKY